MTPEPDGLSYGRVTVRNGDGEGETVVSFPAPTPSGWMRVITGPVVVHLNADGSGELTELDEEAQ